MSKISDLSNDLAGIIQKAGPAIVRVEARRWLPASGSIWSEDGIIVTAHHAVEKDDPIKVGLPDGNTVSASLAGRDPSTDLAVLRVQASGLTALPAASETSIRIGNLALGAARPGEQVQVSLGIVSAFEGAWRTPAGGQVDRYLFADLVMYPGFSGGPLLDAEGQYLGTNTTGLMRNQVATLTVATVKRVVETLLAHGHMRRAYLGIGSQPARLSAGVASSLGQETGLLINSVESGSPAEKGGLSLGDTLINLEGQPVRHLDDLSAALNGLEPGKAVAVSAVRGGVVQTFTVTLGEK